jgi:hypothetical protein
MWRHVIGPLRTTRTGRRPRGQALLEFALVFPIFLMVLFSVISFGLYIFYNQQLANAAREGARWAVTHSATAVCPVVSRLDPPVTLLPAGSTYNRCDPPETGWPNMTGVAQSKVWGMAPSQVSLAACWSGFVDPANNADALPVSPNVFTDCTINRVNPRTDPASLGCPAPATIPSGVSPPKADGDDKASDIAAAPGPGAVQYDTTVTVYACFNWKPPMAGFVIIPSTITIRAVVTESLQRQQ